MKKYAIILAAGKGTRMLTDEPKCSIEFCGRPMISYIVDACKKCDFTDIIVVVGFKKEKIQEIVGNSVTYAYQAEQLGTGHAVLCTEGLIPEDDSICVVLPGDMPLVDSDIIKETIEYNLSTATSMTVVSTIQQNPFGYGRIYREDGVFKKIIEHKDATDTQKEIKEVNTGLYCVNTKLMYEALHQVKSTNNSHEFYFTDIVEIIGKTHEVNALAFSCYLKFTGINDLEALAETQKLYLKMKSEK